MNVPVFPLPEVVLFPKVEIALHLFEPRYRQLGKDVVAGSGNLVMALLRPGYEHDYEGDPPIHEIATLGRVVEHTELEDGRYDIVLRGERRVRLLPLSPGESEHPGGILYRVRLIEPAPERGVDDADVATALKERLTATWSKLLAASGQNPDRGSMGSALEDIVNRICGRIDITVSLKQALLEEDDLAKRARQLIELIDERLAFWEQLARYRHFKPEDPSVN